MTVTRRLYTLLLRLACPWALLWLLWRARGEPGALRGFGARFGFGSRLATGRNLWVHAASVGEVQVAAALVEALRAALPECGLVLTCATPAGRTRAAALCTPAVEVRYAPFDLPGSLERAFRRLQPQALVILETEIWPNLLAACARRGLPVLFASARLSARSTTAWSRWPGLLRPLLARGVSVAAQSETDAARFRRLGVPDAAVVVAGNIKFDRTPPPDSAARGASLRERYAPGGPLWVAGSTRADEEAVVLAAARRVAVSCPGAVLVLAPRHAARFGEVAAAITAAGCGCTRRSGGVPVAGEPRVVLLDTIGELTDFYAAADVAFVGGSLVPAGGHNLLEPAALGIPVLAGPHQFNAPDVARALEDAGALTIVTDAATLAAAVTALLQDPAARARQGAAARSVVAANRGALQRIVALVESVLR